MKTGAELIADERKRQIEVEGWSAEHDTQYKNYELVAAAMCYCQPESTRTYNRLWKSDAKPDNIMAPPGNWPWDKEWWKPTPDDRVRELVKAGALIAAEIDRIQNIQNN